MFSGHFSLPNSLKSLSSLDAVIAEEDDIDCFEEKVQLYSDNAKLLTPTLLDSFLILIYFRTRDC